MRVDAAKGAVVSALKRAQHLAWQPGSLSKPVILAAYRAQWLSREFAEWVERSLLATPMFLSRCAEFGPDIVCDRLPYILGSVRIELRENIRISGRLDIISPHKVSPEHGPPVLRVGRGVFFGHGTSLRVARHIEIGDFTSIGAGSHIADTEGHDAYNPNRPIWEVPASEADVAPVVLEDNVQLGRRVTILKGVRIGARSVIGAESVVRANIPPDSVVMGNPARVVRRIQAPSIDAGPKPEDKAHDSV